MKILVIGSFMMDLVVQTPRAPEEGETIIGTKFDRFPGGKGANQAVAASRLGAEVVFAGKFGNDIFGKEAYQTLEDNHIDVENVLFDDENATGVGSVTLDENGENRIIVVPGANLTYSLEDLASIKNEIKDAAILVLQLEMDLEMTEQAINYAHEYGTKVILNPAPACKLSDDLLSKVDYLTPNQTEAELLTDIKAITIEGAKEAANALLKKGVKNVVLTLGKDGALLVNSEETLHVKGFEAKQVDTVAAGDSFNGALAYGLTLSKSLKDNITYANAVGALTITKKGAIPSLPTKAEVDAFIAQQVE